MSSVSLLILTCSNPFLLGQNSERNIQYDYQLLNLMGHISKSGWFCFHLNHLNCRIGLRLNLCCLRPDPALTIFQFQSPILNPTSQCLQSQNLAQLQVVQIYCQHQLQLDFNLWVWDSLRMQATSKLEQKPETVKLLNPESCTATGLQSWVNHSPVKSLFSMIFHG